MSINSKCVCGRTLKYIKGTVTENFKFVGDISVSDVFYYGCHECGIVSYPNETAVKIDEARSKKLNDFLQNEPFKELLTTKETYEYLGITKQGFQQNEKRLRFIFSTIKDGKTYYHKRSVEFFKQTGDGRFDIDDHDYSSVLKDAIWGERISHEHGKMKYTTPFRIQAPTPKEYSVKC